MDERAGLEVWRFEGLEGIKEQGPRVRGDQLKGPRVRGWYKGWRVAESKQRMAPDSLQPIPLKG